MAQNQIVPGSVQLNGISLSGLALVQSGAAYSVAYQRANGYTCPVGATPGRAFVMLPAENLPSMVTNKAKRYTLDMEAGKHRIKIAGLYFLKSTRAAEHDGPHLVELVDCRHFLAEFSSANKQYNVMMPAPPDDGTDPSLYYLDSLNAGTLWTWQEVLYDLWSLLPVALAGACPTLPYTPAGEPENLTFVGVTAWAAIHRLLDLCGCTTAYDPVAATFDVVQLGEAQLDLAPAIAGFSSRNMHDGESELNSAVAIPETIRVFFPRNEEHYGCEKDTPRDDNWTMAPAYSLDVASGIAGAVADTVAVLWDTMTADYDWDGALLNGAALLTRANELRASWVMDHGQGRGWKIYSGIVPDARCGSEVKSVAWRDWGDGFKTEIISHPSTATLPVQDVSPKTYPHVSQVVAIYSAGAVGAAVAPLAGDDVFDGRVQRVDPRALTCTALDKCWVKVYNTTPASLPNGNKYVGRLCGMRTAYGGETRPLYVVEADAVAGGVIVGRAKAGFLYGGSQYVDLYQESGHGLVWTGQTVLCFNYSVPQIIYGEYLLVAPQQDEPDNWLVVDHYPVMPWLCFYLTDTLEITDHYTKYFARTIQGLEPAAEADWLPTPMGRKPDNGTYYAPTNPHIVLENRPKGGNYKWSSGPGGYGVALYKGYQRVTDTEAELDGYYYVYLIIDLECEESCSETTTTTTSTTTTGPPTTTTTTTTLEPPTTTTTLTPPTTTTWTSRPPTTTTTTPEPTSTTTTTTLEPPPTTTTLTPPPPPTTTTAAPPTTTTTTTTTSEPCVDCDGNRPQFFDVTLTEFPGDSCADLQACCTNLNGKRRLERDPLYPCEWLANIWVCGEPTDICGDGGSFSPRYQQMRLIFSIGDSDEGEPDHYWVDVIVYGMDPSADLYWSKDLGLTKPVCLLTEDLSPRVSDPLNACSTTGTTCHIEAIP